MSTQPEIVIRPHRDWWQIDWAEMLRYRDLLYMLVWRDFIAKYKQTILGPAWFILQPLLTTFVFTIIFARVANIPTDGLPPTLFYLAGLVTWNYFANVFSSNATTFTSQAHIFSKVYFPRLIVPISAAVSNLLAALLQFLTLAGFWVWFRFFTEVGGQLALRWEMVLFPLVLLQAGLCGLGVALIYSALTAKYRDLSFLLAFVTQTWMYATPVIYSLSIIPDNWRWLAYLNPMTQPVEATKLLLLGQGTVALLPYIQSLLVTVLLVALGLALFHRTERTFVDTV